MYAITCSIHECEGGRPMMADPTQPRIQANMVIRNIGQLVTIAQQPIPGATSALQVISDAALAVHDGTIVWIGPDDDAEPMFYHDIGSPQDGITIVDAQGAVVTPGLIDSHTHLVFAGDRSEEFYLRRSGVSYAELLAQGRRDEYVTLIVEEMLPSFVGLARFCDVFCEREAFTAEECRRILTRARELGYQLKIHADQLTPSGGARLAAELGAISADHLDYATDADLDALRDAGIVATLLPGCSYTLRSPYPQARRYLDRGLRVALATDFNPGTSYCENMQTMIGLAMSSMDMTLEEALTAATINGARALQLEKEVGSLEVGKRCELALWSIKSYQEIGYHFGINLIQSVLVQR